MKMRIAALSDIHGNAVALQAVLHDVERQGGADVYWILGDIVALGPSPIDVIEMLQSLPNVRFVRGNTDRYVYSGRDRPAPSVEAAAKDPSLLNSLVECAGTFAWTQGMLCAAGRLHWLEQLPLETECVLADGTRMLGVHASPGCDDGPGLHADLDDTQLEALLDGTTASLILAGHTHQPMNRMVGSRRVINLGSVSNPPIGDLLASYAIVNSSAAGHEVVHRLVDYDRDLVIAEMRRVRHPASGYIIRRLSGGLHSG